MEDSRTSSVFAHDKLSLDERKFLQETEARNKELALKERGVAAKEAELLRSRWLNPTVIGLFAATMGLLGNLYVAFTGNKNTQEVEHSRAQSNLIIQAVNTGDATTACKNLIFFLHLGLLDDPKGTISRCETAPNTIPVLPGVRTYTPITSATAVDDWVMLKTKPRLVDYLLEKTPDGRCGRLILYRKIAKLVLDMLKNVNEIAQPPNSWVDDRFARESVMADAIRSTDPDLPGMVEGDSDIRAISKLYARLLLAHVNDQNWDKLLDELRRSGISVRPGVCDQGQ